MSHHDPIQRVIALALVGLSIWYWFSADFFGHEVLAEIAVFAIFAMSLDLLVGYTGLVSLGHAAFLAIGAYVTAAVTVFLGWPVSVAILASVAASSFIALLLGIFVVRLKGVFFIMVTLATGQIVYAYLFKARAFGGDNGMSGTPRIELSWLGLDANEPAVFSALTLLCALAVYLLLLRIVRSPFGTLLSAIHHNENRARSLGCAVHRYKLIAFVMSGAVAGLAGSLTAQHTGFVSPDLAFWTVSGEVLIMVIAGGMGTLVGAACGATLFILARHTFSDGAFWSSLGLPSSIAEYWQMVLGLIFIAIVLFASDGVHGRLRWVCQKLGLLRTPNV